MKWFLIIVSLLFLTSCSNFPKDKTLLYNGVGIQFTFYPIVGFRMGYFENAVITNKDSNITIIKK